MKTEPLISVIVPIYNLEEYLQICVESLINQTYTNIEIILVNDGSLDGSGQKCEEFKQKDSRIEVIHKENGGLSDARNVGIEAAKGEFITFVDGDDYLEGDCVEYLYGLLDAGNAQVSICSLKKVDYEYNTIDREKQGRKTCLKMTAEGAIETLLYQKYFTTSACAKLYDKTIFREIRFPKGKLHEDMDVVYRALDIADTVIYGGENKYCYFQRQNSIITSPFHRGRMDYIEIAEQMLYYIQGKHPYLYRAAISRCFSANFQLLMEIPMAGHFPKEYKVLAGNIKKYRLTVLVDRKARVMNRGAACISYLGLPFTRMLWRIIGNRR